MVTREHSGRKMPQSLAPKSTRWLIEIRRREDRSDDATARLWDQWLLVRCWISDPADMAFYVTFAPDTTESKELAAVVRLRWTIEECFQSAKGETGLDHCEARSWHA